MADTYGSLMKTSMTAKPKAERTLAMRKSAADTAKASLGGTLSSRAQAKYERTQKRKTLAGGGISSPSSSGSSSSSDSNSSVNKIRMDGGPTPYQSSRPAKKLHHRVLR